MHESKVERMRSGALRLFRSRQMTVRRQHTMSRALLRNELVGDHLALGSKRHELPVARPPHHLAGLVVPPLAHDGMIRAAILRFLFWSSRRLIHRELHVPTR